jgi:hypothetical protein
MANEILQKASRSCRPCGPLRGFEPEATSTFSQQEEAASGERSPEAVSPVCSVHFDEH